MSCYRIPPGALPAGETVEAVDHLHLDPVPRVVGESRRFVGSHVPADEQYQRDVLLLLTSELVTNAVIHARTAIELGVTITNGSLLVTVHDEDLGRSELPGVPREGGWGLGMVDALADAHSMERHPGDGKTAWFRLTRNRQASSGNGQGAA